jgi:electron transfer flavoprotein alpha subunit
LEDHSLPLEMGLPLVLEKEPKHSLFPPIEDKSIVIGVGRGIGSKENIDLVYEFAQSVNAAIACSRPIVDHGWLPSELQVGMSGKSIAPKIYVALGISGSVQHLTGIKGAELIIAVNKDEEAPIFQVAHVSLVGDIRTLLPELKRYLIQEAK